MPITNPPAKLTDQLWMLGSSAYPLYLFQGENEAAVFEGGIGAMGPLLSAQMDELGIGKDSVRQVVVTHAHPDHVMAVPALREMFPEAQVLASETAASTLATEKAIAFFRKIDAALTDSLVKAGALLEEHRGQPRVDKQIAVDRLVKEGDAIVIDGVAFGVLHTPGHSDCSLSFHQPESGVLIVSDATGYYLPEHEYWWPNYFVSYGTYLNSMRRLETLAAETLCLSHNAVIQGAEEVKSYFARAIDATEQYHERIVAEAKAGKSVREIGEQFGAEVYEKTQLLPLEFFQKNCGLLAMKSLKHAGIEPEK